MPDPTIFNERPESQDRAIKVLEKLGYTYVPRAEAERKRGSRVRVLFEDELHKFLSKQTFPFRNERRPFSLGSIGKAVRELDIPLNNGLAITNKQIYDLLCGGKSLEESLPDGSMQSFDLNYIDFENPENNIFQVTDEFEVERPDGKLVRPDIVLFVNGIPLAVIECKKSSLDVMEGVAQNIRNWHPDYIQQLFKYIQIVVAANPHKVLYGTCGTPAKHFTSWREEDKEWQSEMCRKCSPDGQYVEQDRALISLFAPERFLELIRYFIIYDNNIKKIARYKQYFAIKKAMKRIKLEDGKGTRNGVIWHTQGSGKTLTMVMLVKMIQRDPDIKSPRFVLVSDRINLDKQLRDNFIKTNMHPVRAKTGAGLIELIANEENIIITTLVNKFEAAIKQKFVNPNENIFLLIDEGHRTHYGSLNTYMNHALPNAVKIAFTGTPLIKDKKKLTTAKFGPFIDIYSLDDANEDKVIVPLVYEGRYIPQDVTSDKIDDYLKYLTAPLTKEEVEDLKKKWSRFVPLAQTKQRLDMVAFNVYEHFINYCKPKGLKAMLACSSRAAAVDLFYKFKPLEGINPAVVITPEDAKEGDDEIITPESSRKIADFFKKEIDPLYKNKYEFYEDTVRNIFVDPEGEIDLLIVKDKLLTGFDAPIAAVLYVDKPMRDHALLQAIARVNRVLDYEVSGKKYEKEFGLIVDYYGIFKKLHAALDLYNDEKAGMNLFDPEDIRNTIYGPADQKKKLEKAHRDLWDLFKGIDKNETRSNVWQEQLSPQDIRKEFYEKLSRYAKLVDLLLSSYEIFILTGYEKAEEYKQDLLHFQKLRAAVSLRYNDRVDFSKYEDGIRRLLDAYVGAKDAYTIIEPLYILDKNKMQEQLERLGSKEAKADAIRTRLTAELETKQYEDPILYMKFSDQISETLAQYKTERESDAYLASMERLAEEFREGRTGSEYPSKIDNDSDAKAFYGAIRKVLNERVVYDISLELEENLAELSVKVKEVVASSAKRDWRDNVLVHKNIKSKIDDLIFDFMEENKMNWPLEVVDIIIDELMMIAKKRY